MAKSEFRIDLIEKCESKIWYLTLKYGYTHVEKRLKQIIFEEYYKEQQALKIHQEETHEYSLTNYYELQIGLVREYNKLRNIHKKHWYSRIVQRYGRFINRNIIAYYFDH